MTNFSEKVHVMRQRAETAYEKKLCLLCQRAEAVVQQVKRNAWRKYREDREAHDGNMLITSDDVRNLLSRISKDALVPLVGKPAATELHQFTSTRFSSTDTIVMPANMVLKLIEHVERHSEQKKHTGATHKLIPKKSKPAPQKPEQRVLSNLDYAVRLLAPYTRMRENVPVCTVGCQARAPGILVDGTVVVGGLTYDNSIDKGVHGVRLRIKQTDDDAITKLIERTCMRQGDEVRLHFCDQRLMVHAVLHKDPLECIDRYYRLDIQYCHTMTCNKTQVSKSCCSVPIAKVTDGSSLGFQPELKIRAPRCNENNGTADSFVSTPAHDVTKEDNRQEVLEKLVAPQRKENKATVTNEQELFDATLRRLSQPVVRDDVPVQENKQPVEPKYVEFDSASVSPPQTQRNDQSNGDLILGADGKFALVAPPDMLFGRLMETVKEKIHAASGIANRLWFCRNLLKFHEVSYRLPC